jgi:lipopolysaccharide exporter
MLILNNLFRFLLSDNLKAKCAKGSISLTIGAFVAKLMAFASKIVLAKLLAAEERGVMIIILPLVTFFETLTEIGIKQSVIQHKDGGTDPYLNMAWWIQAVRGVCLYLIAFFLSPLLCQIWVYNKEGISDHFNQVDLLWMVRISFLTILFNGLVNPRSEVLMKEFRFARSVILVQGSAIIGSVLTFILAYLYRNVWAFVIGTVSNYFFLVIMSYAMCPFKPKLSYDSKSFHALMHFSKGMAGMPLLTYLAFNLDILVGSLFIAPGLIGMYGFALILARTPREIMTRIFGPLLIPAFAEKQDDPAALCKGLIWITKSVSLVVMPLTVYMIFCRDALLTICYKPEFTEVGIPFALLCLTYGLLLQAFPLGKIFFALGQPGRHRMYVLIRTIMLGGLIWPVVKMYGILGISVLLLVSNIIAFLYQVYTLKAAIGLNFKSYFLAWIPGFAASSVLCILLAGLFLIWPASLRYQFWGGGILLAAVLGYVALYLLKTSRFTGVSKCQS